MNEEQNIPEEYNEQNHSQILNPKSETKNMEQYRIKTIDENNRRLTGNNANKI